MPVGSGAGPQPGIALDIALATLPGDRAVPEVGVRPRAHIATGNRAEALRIYERLRTLLSDELGTDPSSAVEAIYLEAVGS